MVELSAGWPKVVRRFLAEAIYGIQTRQPVHLTEIARVLGEKIHLKKTQYRLSRQVGRLQPLIFLSSQAMLQPRLRMVANSKLNVHFTIG